MKLILVAIVALALFTITAVSSLPAPVAATQVSAPTDSSWNPHVPCQATVTTVHGVIGNHFNSSNGNGALESGGPYGVLNNTDQPSLHPPCSAQNVNGTIAPTFVELHGISLTVDSHVDDGAVGNKCGTTYQSTNGGGLYPGGKTYCNAYGVFQDTAEYTGNCETLSDPNPKICIRLEIDRDWVAAGYCGRGTACDNTTLDGLNNNPNLKIDVQGFVAWHPPSSAGHGYSSWELHPLTAFRFPTPPPPVVADFNWTPTFPTQTVTFTGNASGGIPPYAFSWNFGDGGTGTTNPTNHAYTSTGVKLVQLNVTDYLGATGTVSKNVTVVAPIAVAVTCGSATAGKPVTCTVSATGGTSPYTFSWSAPGGSPATGTGGSFTTTYATKGTFVINATATDSNNVKKSGITSVVVASQQLQVTISAACVNALAPATAGKPISCSATATGGTGPYTFRWTATGGTPASGTGQTFTVSYAVKGTYTLTVNATDANNRSTVQSVTGFVVAAQPIVVTVTCGTATAGKPVTCNASATGGTAPFTFSWSAAGGSPTTGTGASFTTTYATKGSRTVNATARDDNFSKKFALATINVAGQPIVVTVSCGTATLGKPVTCNASATGGTSPFTISWSAPSGTPATGTGTGFTTTYATKGTFVVNATAADVNGAKKSRTASIVVAGQPIVVTVTCGTATSGKPVTCNASATGGTAPFTFSWSAPGGSPATGTGASFTTTYATKGTFVVNATATDNNGAKKSQTAGTVVAAQPIVVTVTCGAATAGTPVTCNASATGGTAPYTFTWASKGTSATGTGPSYTTTYAAKGSQVVNATARDNNAVTKLGQATVNVQGTPIVVTVTCGSATTGKPVTCSASATGGTAPYTFTWSAPGATPATGTGANFTTTYPTKGAFVVNATATDANNLRKSATASIIVSAQPIGLTVTCGSATAGKPVTCNASATGGTSPYAFSWTSSSSSPSSGSGISFTTTFPSKGSYTVKTVVRDANGFNSSATKPVMVTAQPLVADFNFTQPVVVGNPVTFTANVSGGTGPYTFQWSFGDGSPIQSGNSVSHSYTVKGSYSVALNITDANSATITVQKTTFVSPVTLSASFTYTPSAPTAEQAVNFTATVSGGTAPYSASWDFGDNTTGIRTSVSHVYTTSRNYTVTLTVTDANSATAISSRPLTISLKVAIKVSQAPAAGWQTTFNATATGGTGGYSYLWSFGDGANGTSQDPRHVYSFNGNYTVTLVVTDSSGNTGSTSKQVTLMLNPDVDGSGVVNIVDVAHVALAFGSNRGDARYDSRLDLNSDGRIDILDVAAVALYFGRTVGS